MCVYFCLFLFIYFLCHPYQLSTLYEFRGEDGENNDLDTRFCYSLRRDAYIVCAAWFDSSIEGEKKFQGIICPYRVHKYSKEGRARNKYVVEGRFDRI